MRPTCATWVWKCFQPGDWAEIIGALGAALIAALVVMVGYHFQQQLARKERRNKAYAEALRAVEDYREAPYLIMRRDGSHAARMQIVQHVSDVQSRIDFYAYWLGLHTSEHVCDAYRHYVAAARSEAGRQMTDAWEKRPTRRDRDVPIGCPLPQPNSEQAQVAVFRAMKRRF